MRATGQSSGEISLKAFREVQRETSPQFPPYNRASDLTIKKISKVEQRGRGGGGEGRRSGDASFAYYNYFEKIEWDYLWKICGKFFDGSRSVEYYHPLEG